MRRSATWVPSASEAQRSSSASAGSGRRSAREAFLDGYEEIARASWPRRCRAATATACSSSFVLEKAFYELRYELDNRPDWVRVPLRGLSDILGPGR